MVNRNYIKQHRSNVKIALLQKISKKKSVGTTDYKRGAKIRPIKKLKGISYETLKKMET